MKLPAIMPCLAPSIMMYGDRYLKVRGKVKKVTRSIALLTLCLVFNGSISCFDLASTRISTSIVSWYAVVTAIAKKIDG